MSVALRWHSRGVLQTHQTCAALGVNSVKCLRLPRTTLSRIVCVRCVNCVELYHLCASTYIAASSLGYCHQLKLVSDDTADVLSTLLYRIALPCFLVQKVTAVVCRADSLLAWAVPVLLGFLHSVVGAATGWILAGIILVMYKTKHVVLKRLGLLSSSASAKGVANAVAAALGNKAVADVVAQAPPGPSEDLRGFLALAAGWAASSWIPSARSVMPSTSTMFPGVPSFLHNRDAYFIGAAMALWAVTYHFLGAMQPSSGTNDDDLTDGASPNSDGPPMFPPRKWVRVQGNQEVLLDRTSIQADSLPPPRSAYAPGSTPPSTSPPSSPSAVSSKSPSTPPIPPFPDPPVVPVNLDITPPGATLPLLSPSLPGSEVPPPRNVPTSAAALPSLPASLSWPQLNSLAGEAWSRVLTVPPLLAILAGLLLGMACRSSPSLAQLLVSSPLAPLPAPQAIVPVQSLPALTTPVPWDVTGIMMLLSGMASSMRWLGGAALPMVALMVGGTLATQDSAEQQQQDGGGGGRVPSYRRGGPSRPSLSRWLLHLALPATPLEALLLGCSALLRLLLGGLLPLALQLPMAALAGSWQAVKVPELVRQMLSALPPDICMVLVLVLLSFERSMVASFSLMAVRLHLWSALLMGGLVLLA